LQFFGGINDGTRNSQTASSLDPYPIKPLV
jgi:hypothetical protein